MRVLDIQYELKYKTAQSITLFYAACKYRSANVFDFTGSKRIVHSVTFAKVSSDFLSVHIVGKLSVC